MKTFLDPLFVCFRLWILS